MVAGLFGGVNVIWLGVLESLGRTPPVPRSFRAGARFQRFWSGIGLTPDGPHEI